MKSLRPRTYACYLTVLLLAARALAANLSVVQHAGRTELSVEGHAPFYVTEAEIAEARLVEIPEHGMLVALWKERATDAEFSQYYAFGRDGGQFTRARQISYQLGLSRAACDPLQGMPELPDMLRSDAFNRVYLVQYYTHPLEAYRKVIRDLGGVIHTYMPKNAQIVAMDAATKARVESLPYVRWVGPFHPGYRLEGFLLENLDRASDLLPMQRYNILVFERGHRQKALVAAHIQQVGGVAGPVRPNGFLMQATLTPEQLLSVLRLNEVAFVERWSPASFDMDIARAISGVNYVETTSWYTGADVVGEVCDSYLLEDHPAFLANPPTLHGPNGNQHAHGTMVYGTIFGDGNESPDPNALGIAPSATGIFASACRFEDFGVPECEGIPDGVDRYCHTCELVSDDCDFPLGPCTEEHDVEGPFNAVFQTNSWGHVESVYYGAWTYEIDDILFQYDILVCQAQGNKGMRSSKPEAWAKNIVSVGGVMHFNTPSKGDDAWDHKASTGPARDGRVKPDLIHFYDSVLTTSHDGAYTSFFGGTSAATPITCGLFGLFFQMWNDGIFGNEVADPNCDPQLEPCVFKNRPHMTTAKAMMINTAVPYCFNDPVNCPSSDFTRDNQGWGMADIGKVYALRDHFPVIDDETTLLDMTPEHDHVVYPITVDAHTYALKATLVYADPPGAPSATKHVINDLDLKVISPDQTVYWGNCDLIEGKWSSADCTQHNPPRPEDPEQEPVIDNVENVFIQDPASGTWSVEVIGYRIVEDAHVETAEMDADFALVVSLDRDCNSSNTPDAEDISREVSQDMNDNGVPDECEDCQPNGVPDDMDIAGQTSDDINENSVPDECEDCQPNGVPDDMDITTGSSDDANENGIPDECEVPTNRYLLFAPTESATPLAYQLRMTASTYFPEATGVLGWVGPPGAPRVSSIEDVPYYTDEWPGAVYVGDCGIVPAATYELRSTADGSSFSDPVILETIAQPAAPHWWADTVGVGGGAGWTPPNGVVNFSDIQAVVQTFERTVGAPHWTWVDVAVQHPDRVVNMSDIQMTILAFEGAQYPYGSPALCGLGDGMGGEGGGMDSEGTTTFSLAADPELIDPDDTFDLEVYIDEAEDLGAYQVTLEVTGGDSGSLTLEDLFVDTEHDDFVFYGDTVAAAVDESGGRLGAVRFDGGVNVTESSYLATFRFRASNDASGVFAIEVKANGASFVNNGDGFELTSDTGDGANVGVDIECFTDEHCDDDNDCTTDTCESYECSNTNKSSGTPCDDGMFCTETDECDGNGTCVGTGNPCGVKAPKCCEDTDECVDAQAQCPSGT